VTGPVPPEIERVVARLEPELGRAAGPPRPLEGGITNRNFRVTLGAGDYVLRLPGKDTELLGIDREAEAAAQTAAAALGVAPDVVTLDPEDGCLVTRFVGARPLAEGELREPELLGHAARALRLIHSGRSLPTTFSAWEITATYRATAIERGAEIPPQYDDASAVAREIEPLMQGTEHHPVPCHNDLLPANLLVDPQGVLVVDWEYAGMGDRYFDLANLSVNNGFDPEDDGRLLAAYFGEPCTPGRLARLRLMRLMSDFREAMWGVLQSTVSELDFDFSGYAAEHFDRLLGTAAEAAYATWLADARHELGWRAQ
jgi:thiamine kinase-like enzyme